MATFDLFRNKSLSQNEQFRKRNSGDTIHKICLKNGTLTSILLIMSFLAFCGITNRLEVHQLSAINMFLLAFGAYFAIENISPTGKAGSVDYFEGFKVGLYTALISTVIYSCFLLVFAFFDPSILSGARSGHILGSPANPLILTVATLFEGMASSFIITFCLMQYFKKNEP